MVIDRYSHKSMRKAGNKQLISQDYDKNIVTTICEANYFKDIQNKLDENTYWQLLDELQLLPSIKQFPIPISSPLGLQALDEHLLNPSIVLKLGNWSRPKGCSTLDILELESVRETGINSR